MARASGYRIRPATLRDLDVLVLQRRGMWRDISDHTEAELAAADPVYREWARPRLKSGKLVGFLAETLAGETVAGGCLWMRPNQPRPGWDETESPYLLSMYTEPAHRGRGLASRIVEAAIDWARSHGYPRMTLHAADDARGIYRRQGFERTWEMRLRLTSTGRHGSSHSRPRSRGPPAPRRRRVARSPARR